MYIPVVCTKIGLGLEQEWKLKTDQICHKTVKEIDGLIWEIELDFWDTDFPK